MRKCDHKAKSIVRTVRLPRDLVILRLTYCSKCKFQIAKEVL